MRSRDHTTETLGTYAIRWLARRAPFIEPGTEAAYRNDIICRIAPTLGTLRLRDATVEAIERAILEMQRMKPAEGQDGRPTARRRSTTPSPRSRSSSALP